MAKIVIDETVFDELDQSALYESEFERIVLQQAPYLFPGFRAVEFKCLVCNEEDCSKPDLALIDVEYRQWWVVEVEMTRHSLKGHVIPQVSTFASATYGQREASYLHNKDRSLEVDRLDDMMKGIQPQVLVIVNGPKPEWVQPLRQFNAKLVVVQVFRSERNKLLLLFDGEVPTVFVANVLSRCFLDPYLPGFLAIESPSSLGLGRNERVRLYTEGKVTEWERVDSGDKVWLCPVKGPNPLNPDHSYEIARSESGSLNIRKV